MKKLSKLKPAVWLAAVLLFSGCGSSDLVADDLARFMNTDMTEINAKCDAMTKEAGRWNSLGSDGEFIASIADVMLPNVNASIELLEEISPQTEEVKDLKEKYMSVLLKYRGGFETMLEGFRSRDEELIASGSDKVKQGNSLLDSYNASLAALAAENDLSFD